MEKYDVYKDIATRTDGELYIGVVGPVRTGKSTFIKRFMEIYVIPYMDDVYQKERVIDELPLSSSGTTIMTTEPKFIPNEAATIRFEEDKSARIRLIDCVGFMVNGATGHMEQDAERMVKTPWQDEPMPFTKAAETGTRKVIHDHSNIGLVITSDGSFGDLKRENYLEAEQMAVKECQNIGKPFIILLNTQNTQSDETKLLAQEMEQAYHASVLPINCQTIERKDIEKIMTTILEDFKVSQIHFQVPKWVELLPADHWLKKDVIVHIKEFLKHIRQMKDIKEDIFPTKSQYIKEFSVLESNLENGNVTIGIHFDEEYYYKILSDVIGVDIAGEYDLITTIRDLAKNRSEYEKISTACTQVKGKGYGIVTPTKDEIQIANPELIKHGSKYGVKIKAICPSIHLIQANIETEIAPIVGNESQAQDLIRYIESNAQENSDGIFDTNIFGKSIRELVDDGIYNKVNRLTEESQVKLQDAIQKVVNDSNGGLVCIII